MGVGVGGWVAGLTEIKANSASQQSWSWSWGLAELGNILLSLLLQTLSIQILYLQNVFFFNFTLQYFFPLTKFAFESAYRIDENIKGGKYLPLNILKNHII